MRTTYSLVTTVTLFSDSNALEIFSSVDASASKKCHETKTSAMNCEKVDQKVELIGHFCLPFAEILASFFEY